MTISTVLIIILGTLFYFVLPFIIWACFKNEKIKNILTICFFFLYLVVLFIGVFGKLDINDNVVSFSFDFSGSWCAKPINFSLASISTFDLVINIVMLIPVGMFVSYFMKNKNLFLKIISLLGVGLFVGLFIETCQFILPVPRSVQLSDALLNTVSVFVGGLIAWLYLWIIKKFKGNKQ